MRIYGYGAEYFQWSPESMSRRGITSDHQKGLIVGDIYLQTRVRLLSENAGWRPNVVLNYTLKTASPKPIANESMRFFDTPGYFFHLEVGRNLLSPDASPVSLRISGHIGFLCAGRRSRSRMMPLRMPSHYPLSYRTGILRSSWVDIMVG